MSNFIDNLKAMLNFSNHIDLYWSYIQFSLQGISLILKTYITIWHNHIYILYILFQYQTEKSKFFDMLAAILDFGGHIGILLSY